MAVELGVAYVTITASAKGIAKSLRDEVEGPVSSSAADAGDKAGGKFKDSFGEHLKTLTKVASGAFAGLAVGNFLKDSISAASDFNESLSKVNVVFGDSAPIIENWSKSAAESLGQSQQQALEAAGTFGNLFRAMGIGTPVAADMSQKIIGLAGDLASFNNANPEDVLIALKSGLVGETEPLRAFGVNLNEDRIKAEAFSLGLVKASVDSDKLSKAQEAVQKSVRKVAEARGKFGEDSMQFRDAVRDEEQAQTALAKVMEGKMPASLDAATKAQAAYSLIMKDTTLAQGDFARTSDGLANRQRILSAKFKDLKATLGAQLLPVVNAVGGFLLDKVVPAFQALASALSGEGITSDGFIGVMEHIGVVIRGVVTAAVDNFPKVRDAIVPVLEKVASVLGNVFKFVMDHKEILVGLAVVIGGALVAAFASWAVAAGSAAVATIAAAAPVVAIGVAIAALVAGVIYAYKHWEFFRVVVDAVASFLKDTLWPIIQTVAAALISFAQSFISNVVPVLQAGWGLISAAVTAAWGVFQTMLAIVTPILSTLLQIAGSVFEQIVGVISTFVGIAGPLISGWIQAAWTVVSTYINIIKDVIEGVLGVIRGIFQAITGLITGDWDQFWGGIQTVASSVFGAVKGIIDDVWQGIKGVFQTGIDTVKTVVSNGIDTVVGFFTGIGGRISSAASGMWDGITKAFRGAINGVIDIWNGLEFSVPGFSAFGHEIGGFTIGVPNLPHLASGGLITRAGAALVGENGPEVVTLPAGAGVIPNNRIGPPINLSFYNSQITARQAMEEAAWYQKTGGR